MDGIQATRRITELGLQTKVLVLTIHDEDEFLITVLDAGAAGFLNKSAADTDLPGAIEAVVRGHSYPPRRTADLLARREAQGRVEPRTGSRGGGPTPAGRERAVGLSLPPPNAWGNPHGVGGDFPHGSQGFPAIESDMRCRY